MRVFLGIDDRSGQTVAMARGLRELGVQAEAVNLAPHRYGYEYDRILSKKRRRWRSLSARAAEAVRAFGAFDVFDFQAGTTLLPGLLDLKLLKSRAIFMHFWGTELRRMASENRDRLARLASGVSGFIVADLELASFLPNDVPIHLIPQAVEPRRASVPDPARGCPLVVHAPSARSRKGTDTIVRAMQRLKAEGVQFEFVLLENLSHSALMTEIAQADVVIDQVSEQGVHGVLAVEAMSMGKPTAVYVSERWRASYPDDFPGVPLDPDNLEHSLRGVLEDGALRKSLGMRSAEYTRRRHHPRAVAAQLLRVYESAQ